jgi:predicted DNA-binding antitoxin AbrB/MazE fold protein
MSSSHDVGYYQAKTHLPRRLERVKQGDAGRNGPRGFRIADVKQARSGDDAHGARPSRNALDKGGNLTLRCFQGNNIMSTQVEAIYENGVFRPLQPVHLPESKHVLVTIDQEVEIAAPSDIQAHFVLPSERWQEFCEALDSPPKHLPRLRKLLTETGLFDANGSTAR